jgi:DNA repair photolyase
MRWDGLKAESDTDGQLELPGLGEAGGVVRTFDAPEALDMRFHEVRAKSALNRVPAKSRMPFRWTINAFRGCSHACTYCAAPETPVLLANGSTRPLAELRRGDEIYGTCRRGSYRRYVKTRVLAHWATVKTPYRVTLEDGTELVTSGDHRFLSNRGWKHVTGAEQGSGRRPHLTVNNELLGTGRFERGPAQDEDYRRGYLCGLIRGDGHIGSYSYDRPGRAHGDVHRFRLALTDFEALRRAREYLAEIEIAVDEFQFTAAVGAHREVRAIRAQAKGGVAAIARTIEWPMHPTAEWRKGFLAGIFDAEGSYGRGILRICNTDPELIGRTVDCLASLDFNVVIEDRRQANGLKVARVRGGLAEALRFFHLTEPAIFRKRSIEGVALKCEGQRRVAEIEPLGRQIEMFDITTGTEDFIANGVVSHNCFARPTHEYLGFDAGRDFERQIVVKVNAPELLRAELRKPTWARELVAFGTNTDPYQWAEGRYRLMPPMLEALAEARTPVSILTKSSLVMRDLDQLREMAKLLDVSVNFSVPTLEEKAWRATEPHTPHPRKRLEAVAELNRVGIPSGVLIAPLMPGINDSPEQVEKIIELCEEAGATFIGGIALHLRPGVREVFMSWLAAARPDLVEHYEELYRKRSYLPAEERRRIEAPLRRLGPVRRSRFAAGR